MSKYIKGAFVDFFLLCALAALATAQVEVFKKGGGGAGTVTSVTATGGLTATGTTSVVISTNSSLIAATPGLTYSTSTPSNPNANLNQSTGTLTVGGVTAAVSTMSDQGFGIPDPGANPSNLAIGSLWRRGGTLYTSSDGATPVSILTSTFNPAGTAFTGGNVANATDFQSSVTFHNAIQLPTNQGIAQGISLTTMSPNGYTFFIDSMSIVGTTATIGGGSMVWFATVTMSSNTFTNPGETLKVECVYLQWLAPTTPNESISIDGTVVTNVTASNTTANDSEIFETDLELIRLNQVYPTKVAHRHINGNSNAGEVATGAAMAAGSQVSVLNFVTANVHIIRCGASTGNGAGTVGFVSMRVGKGS